MTYYNVKIEVDLQGSLHILPSQSRSAIWQGLAGATDHSMVVMAVYWTIQAS